ncbi:hypothetical protein DB30_00684 [Enhygromyxa salina]|uniref:Polyketide cyclase / dehydrase and lipid transport n=1 Tax=Enhygromyxa salina TaxID=215803 RepID=A0A0C1ZLJ2_9BACT|nr:DUF2505 family protein [Enhygromyxa salina]KIG18399.1 hypothetical protein DB30_00684 [Enhygromyxa salina]
MRRCDISLELDCPPDRFWRLYFDEDFTRETFERGLGWSAPKYTEFRSDEHEIIRHLSAQPKLDISGKAAKLIGEQLGYQEKGRFDRKTQRFEFSNRTNIFGERMKLSAKMWAEPIGESRMRWRTEMTIDCSIFGVGGLLERTAEQNIEKTYPTCAKYWNRYFADHPE